MSIRCEAGNVSEKGYASTFVTQMERSSACLERGIKVVSNAGGINPPGCPSASQNSQPTWLFPRSLCRWRRPAPPSGDLERTAVIHRTGGSSDWFRCNSLTANAYLGGWASRKPLPPALTFHQPDGSRCGLGGGPARGISAGLGTTGTCWRSGGGRSHHRVRPSAPAGTRVLRGVPVLERVGFPIAETIRWTSVKPSTRTRGARFGWDVTAQLLYEIGPPHY